MGPIFIDEPVCWQIVHRVILFSAPALLPDVRRGGLPCHAARRVEIFIKFSIAQVISSLLSAMLNGNLISIKPLAGLA